MATASYIGLMETRTLDGAVLQTLLTSCQELIRSGSNSRRKKISSIYDTKVPVGAIGKTFNCFSCLDGSIRRWEMRKNQWPTYQEVLEAVRNALSHPTEINLDHRYPSTGYTTHAVRSGQIDKYVFIDSEYVKKGNQPKKWLKKRADEELIKAKDLYGRISTELILKPIEQNQHGIEEFGLFVGERRFLPEARIEVTVREIRELVERLVKILSAAKDSRWEDSWRPRQAA